MRIVIWTDAFWPEIGGLEVFCMRLSTALQSRGHTCQIIANCPMEMQERIGLYEGIPVHRFALQEALNRGGLAHFRRENEKCERAIAEFQPDVIHLNSSSKCLLSFMLQQRNRRRPTLLTLHDRHVYRKPSVLAGEILDQVDVLAAISEFIQRDALIHFPQLKDKLHIVPNALPDPGVQPSPLPTSPRFLAMGRLVKDKGFDLALEAFAQLAAEFEHSTLTLAGDGLESENLQALARKLGIAERVHFPGWISPDEIPGLINAHSLVIMPSRWIEPFGLVALQTAQMGRPICASRSGGIPEIVVDGKTGKLFESENVADLAAALRFFLENPDKAVEMGRKAHVHAREHFNFDHFITAYENLYATIRLR